MLNVEHMLMLIEPFCRARGIKVSRLSFLLFNDGKRLKSMIEDRTDISSRKLIAALQWFSDHWPEGAEWPAGVQRPEPTRSAA